ncbi:MAG: hypothetical protein KDA25_12495 [Phycisphaerales bacterium]|nr:hypothetical protein [Phycisphaerales bacterium]
MRTMLGLIAGAGLGAAVGHSQILCADGQCIITGSWYGGAVIGGLLGLMLLGPTGGRSACRMPPTDEDPTPSDPTDGA